VGRPNKIKCGSNRGSQTDLEYKRPKNLGLKAPVIYRGKTLSFKRAFRDITTGLGNCFEENFVGLKHTGGGIK